MVSLKKNVIRVVVSVAVAALLAVAVMCCFSDRSEADKYHCAGPAGLVQPDAIAGKTKSHRVWPETVEEVFGPRPASVQADDATMKELVSIRDTLIQAYTNRQASVLAEWRDKLPGTLATLPSLQFNEIMDPLKLLVGRDIMPSANDEHPLMVVDPEKLRGYFDTILNAVLLIGDTALNHDPNDHVGGAFEGWVFKMLNGYKARLRQGEYADLESVVDDAISRWSAVSESDQGYCKRNAMQQISLLRLGGPRDLDNMSWGEFVADRLKVYSQYLVHCGYTPRWATETLDVPEPGWYKERRNLLKSSKVRPQLVVEPTK